MNAALVQAARSLSVRPTLLVACDFDGTLASIAPTPNGAAPTREALAGLRRLAAAPGVTVAVVSGRGLRDLSERLGDAPGVRLVGSHGGEHGEALGNRLGPHEENLRDRIRDELRALASGAPGALVEEKPAGAALHVRQVAPPLAEWLVSAALERVSSLAGVHTKRGKAVVEFAALPANKGEALRRLRAEASATAALFIGDDETDEDAFAALVGPDVGIKVGEGETRARLRLACTEAVTQFLAMLADARAVWLAGGAADPIEAHTLLSDQRSAALIDTRGRVVWLCAPRVDSPAVFADLLGGAGAGAFTVAPAHAGSIARVAYAGNTLIARTAWAGLEVVDYLDCAGGRPFQRSGRSDLIRVVTAGVPATARFALRLDFGRKITRFQPVEGGLRIDGSPDPICLVSPGVAWKVADDGDHHVAHASLDPRPTPYVFELRFGIESLAPSPLAEEERRRQTERFWTSWASSLRLPGVADEYVLRSALAIKALCHGPTGAIAAAATTSLPETIGGVRNWDYRFCWPRDACMAARSLLRLGNTGVGLRLLDWLLGVLDTIERPERLRPIYTVSGRELPPEAEISELAGYAGSRPVRVSNAAAQQVQLDVFGPVTDLVAALAEAGAPVTPEHWRLTEAMVEAIAARWREPDAGIWEIRTPGRRHTHSAAMCWFGVDRALRLAERSLSAAPAHWAPLRDAIRDETLRLGWSNALGAFSAAFDTHEPDAATLCLGLTGMLPSDDPRWHATLDVVSARLREGAGVRRYLYDDGLPGREGGFLLCTGWLIQALVGAGRRAEAAELFAGMLAVAGPTGLLPEQIGPPTDPRGLGNFPQVYSHVAVIDSACALAGLG